MQAKSAGFREHNQILFSAKVIPCELKTEVGVLRGDVIDINHNQKADTEQTMDCLGFRGKLVCAEPALAVPYAQIAEHARGHEIEVVTQDDVEVNLKDLGVTATNYIFAQAHNLVPENLRSISSIVPIALPLDKDPGAAKWAFDTATQEFLLFKPR